MPSKIALSLRRATQRLRREIAPMQFGAPVTHVYNPLDYAASPHSDGRPLRQHPERPRLVEDRGRGLPPGSRTSEAAGAGFRLPPGRSQWYAGMGSDRSGIRDAGKILRALLYRELLPAGLRRGDRTQPHPGKAARRRTKRTLCRLRSAPAEHRACPRARMGGRNRPVRRNSRIRGPRGLGANRTHPPPEPGQPAGTA